METVNLVQHRGQDGAGICNIDDEEDKIKEAMAGLSESNENEINYVYFRHKEYIKTWYMIIIEPSGNKAYLGYDVKEFQPIDNYFINYINNYHILMNFDSDYTHLMYSHATSFLYMVWLKTYFSRRL